MSGPVLDEDQTELVLEEDNECFEFKKQSRGH
jgi:hypothetical protein